MFKSITAFPNDNNNNNNQEEDLYSLQSGREGDVPSSDSNSNENNNHRYNTDLPILYSEEVSPPPRKVHPTSQKLFSACGGRFRWIRKIPIFGPSLETFGPKVVFALDMSEFLSKGVANYTMQNTYQPMFMTRFASTTADYQKYNAVAMMGWNIKPLIALLSDSVVLGGYKKRYYLIFSSVLGALTCMGYGLLPAKVSSGEIAAGLCFLASFSQANIDILTEGLYSRLIRAEPKVGPVLVSSIWWTLNIGSIVAAFIEGPLSDAGKPQIGAFVAMACMLLTIPIFFLNLLGEQKNLAERRDDYEKMLLLEQQKEEEESPMLEEADVDVSAFLGNPSQGKELQQSFNSVQMTQKHQEEKVPTDEERTALSDELPMPSDINNGEIENNNNKEELDSMTSAELRELLNIKSFCNGLTDVNAGVISKNYRISLFAFLMSACVITQAVITTVASTWVIVGVSAGISLLVCLTCFYVFPKVIAKAALFVFLQTLLYMQITSPLNNFYLADKKCLPDGPHFDYFFYNTTSSVIGNVAGMLGVYAFAHFFANRSYRLTFIVTTIAEIIGSIFDLIIVMRWNVKLHIPDHVMYIWGDAVVYQAAYMLAWMPMVVLLSRLCPRGSEAMVYALLASISNLGQTMAQEVGAALLATVWPVVAQGPHCNFDNLKYLIIVGHLCLPLLIIPCVFLLIPAARVCDALDNEGKVIPKEKEENAIFEQEKKKKREKEAEPTADV